MPVRKKKGGKGEKGAESSEEPWIEVQKKTFTNWVNYKLRNTDYLVEDLAKDLEDGLVLIQLLQELSRKTITEKYVM